MPLAQIIYSLWSPLLGQFSVDGVQAKNDQIHSRPGNFKYSGFRRSLAVSFPKLSFFSALSLLFLRSTASMIFWNLSTPAWWRRGWRFSLREQRRAWVCSKILFTLDRRWPKVDGYLWQVWFFFALLYVYIVLPWNILVLSLSLSVLFLSFLFHLCLEISRPTPQFNKI